MQSEEQGQTRSHTTAGGLLREAREAARMQLPSMAATLKVPQRKLEALEADDYDSFPDHVFMRALAMGMCRILHIDAEPILALMPSRELKSLAKTGPGINQTVKMRSSFRATGTPLDSGRSSSRKIAAGVLVLLAAAAAMYFVPFHQSVDGGATASVAAQTEVTNSAGAADPAVAVPLGRASNSGEADSVVTEPSAEPAASAVAAAPAAVAAPVSAAEAKPAASTAALLALKVNTGQSWVKVKDATGKVVLEKTLAKDESATAEGQLPLSVIVGNAKGTQVLVRGEPLDISTTRDNVARFEVK